MAKSANFFLHVRIVERNGPLDKANNAKRIQFGSKAHRTQAQFLYPFQIAESDKRQVQCNSLTYTVVIKYSTNVEKIINTFCGDDSIFYLD